MSRFSRSSHRAAFFHHRDTEFTEVKFFSFAAERVANENLQPLYSRVLLPKIIAGDISSNMFLLPGG
jgi:hypothetical protein